ncbi:MAG TPA: hypothetical protein VLA93_12890 [Pyrinomonadaceae bacterium]|nr:hypothetical protein [Pyrinomonadaceae bacterium]
MNLRHKIELVALALIVACACSATGFGQTQSANDLNPSTVNNNESGTLTAASTHSTKIAEKGIKKTASLFDDSDPKAQSTDPDEWHFQFSPYLWIAGVTGRAGIGDLVVDIDSGLTDDNVKLNSGFMGTFEARKNKFVLLADLQYSNLGTERPSPRGLLFSGAEADFKTFIFDPEVGYRVAENIEKRRSVDILGGIRIWRLETNLNFLPGILAARSAAGTRSWVDAVGGVRGKMYLSKSIFIAGKGDLGGGGAKFTWQLFGGAGVHVHSKIALIGGYRALSVNYDRDNFLFDTTLSGPMIGAMFIVK